MNGPDPKATTIRVPAKFFNDHQANWSDRGCRGGDFDDCWPVRVTSKFVWLEETDPGLAALLEDALRVVEHPLDRESNRLRGSAKATSGAIRQWFWLHRPDNACIPEAVADLTGNLRAEKNLSPCSLGRNESHEQSSQESL
jgi:hypothetical protein